MDVTSPDFEQVLNQLVSNDTTPLIAPYKWIDAGLMHNKFVIIDNSRVWTRSANFTEVVLNSNSRERLNNENVVIINSQQVAQNFQQAFNAIEEEI